jgi:amino acid adenylation domain-containing protein
MLNCIRQCEQPAQSILSTSENDKNTLIKSRQGTSKAWSKTTLTQALNEIATNNANALSLADKTWNYQTLSLHINGMSNELRQQGIGQGDRVAIILSRSFEFVISCFAVLKAGASYVPIDPKMPANRQRYICEDANIDLIINEHVTSIEVSSLAIKTLAVKALKELTSESAITIPVDNFSEAYVIYTSGSTGVPKGVSISRGALLNHTNSAIDAYNISQKDTGLQFSSLSFDTAVEEIYPIIFQSGHLVLRDDNIMASSDEFINLIEKHQISILNFPTAFWTNWVSQLNQQNRALPSCTRLLIIGGEEALTSTLSHWQEYCELHQLSILLFNTYGPTEATVVTTRVEMSHWKNNSTRLPIGRPIDNVDCYIVNNCHDVLPDGFIGELAITGQGLATHYLNNEQLTAERFINTSTIGRSSETAVVSGFGL